jgi:uracil-DNA glycosylase
MWHDPFWSFLEKTVFSAPGILEGNKPLFNQYHDTNPDFDLPQAALIRRANLFRFLDSLPERPPVFLVGEAPGWHGCRFSGVPFTSEAQLSSGGLPFQGHLSSHSGAPHAEASATIFWQALKAHHPQFFVWSGVPFHPYRPGQPLSNRTPSLQELRAYLPVLEEMIRLLSPKRVLAVGRQAQQALRWLDIPAQAVRHPSHGGAVEFKAGIEEALRHTAV